MDNILIFNPADPTVSYRVTQYISGVNGSDYTSNPYAPINPSMSSVSGISMAYWKVDTTNVVEMSTQEKSLVDQNISYSDVQITQASEISTNSTDWQDAIRQTYKINPGSYKIDFSCEVSTSSSNGKVKVKIGSGATEKTTFKVKVDNGGYTPLATFLTFTNDSVQNIAFWVQISTPDVSYSVSIRNIYIKIH